MTNAGDYQIEASDFEWLVGYLNEEELAPPVPVSPEAPLPTSPSADSEPGSLDGVTLKPIEVLEKPKTAYARYIKDARARIKGESPSASPSDVHSLALAAWKAAGKEEKAPYDAAFTADKARYEKECAEAGIEPAKRGRKSGDGDAAPPQQPPVSNGPAGQAAFALDQAKRTGAEAAEKRRASGALEPSGSGPSSIPHSGGEEAARLGRGAARRGSERAAARARRRVRDLAEI